MPGAQYARQGSHLRGPRRCCVALRSTNPLLQEHPRQVERQYLYFCTAVSTLVSVSICTFVLLRRPTEHKSTPSRASLLSLASSPRVSPVATYIHIHIYVHEYRHTHIHTYIHTYSIYIHTCIHIDMRAYACHRQM